MDTVLTCTATFTCIASLVTQHRIWECCHGSLRLGQNLILTVQAAKGQSSAISKHCLGTQCINYAAVALHVMHVASAHFLMDKLQIFLCPMQQLHIFASLPLRLRLCMCASLEQRQGCSICMNVAPCLTGCHRVCV